MTTLVPTTDSDEIQSTSRTVGLRRNHRCRFPSTRPAILPNRMQREALTAIAEARDDGADRAIVISATGTGKTILSALDVRAVNPERMLFVVHREQILDRTIQEYQSPRSTSERLRQADWGLEADRPAFRLCHDPDPVPDRRSSRSTRAPSTTCSSTRCIEPAPPRYRRVIDHFHPDFLLGMTATPERTDGFNIFELFDYNVAYEIRLNRRSRRRCSPRSTTTGSPTLPSTTDDHHRRLHDLRALISPERVRSPVSRCPRELRAGRDRTARPHLL